MLNEELSSPGERMRWLRVGQDLTQETLAAKATVSQNAISQIERDVFVPRPVIRRLIAEALGVHHDLIWRPADLAKRKRVAA